MTNKKVQKERVYSAYTSRIAVLLQRQSGWELKKSRLLEAGDDAELMEGCFLLA